MGVVRACKEEGWIDELFLNTFYSILCGSWINNKNYYIKYHY
jgi:hypothetical protein